MSQQLAEVLARQLDVVPVKPPALENGDHLARGEFERRYRAKPDIGRAELVEGVVFIRPSSRFRDRGEPHLALVVWLGAYCSATPGVSAQDNTRVRLDFDNEPQPHLLLRIEPAVGGRSAISRDDCVEGAPELIVEIAASSVSYDLHDKLQAYRRNGVQEYIVWRVDDKQIDWFQLVEGNYVRMEPNESHLIQSHVFPGLRLAVQALLDGDLAKVLAEQQKGFGTIEHTAFLERLQRK
jgi:Uma2 family endonuclease